MSHVAYTRLDGELGVFDPEDEATERWEGPLEPARLRSEREILECEPSSLKSIPMLPGSTVIFRSRQGHWILHQRRTPIIPSFRQSDPRRGKQNAQLSLREATSWFELRRIPLPSILVEDIKASLPGDTSTKAKVTPLRTTSPMSEPGQSEGTPLTTAASKPEKEEPAGTPTAELPDLVSLDQAAALVNRSPAALRHYRSKGMPKPYVQGAKGRPNEYLWSEMRPWLQTTFNREIPQVSIQKFRSNPGK
jgi:hypothetical protein